MHLFCVLNPCAPTDTAACTACSTRTTCGPTCRVTIASPPPHSTSTTPLLGRPWTHLSCLKCSGTARHASSRPPSTSQTSSAGARPPPPPPTPPSVPTSSLTPPAPPPPLLSLESDVIKALSRHRSSQGLTFTVDDRLGYLLSPALAAYEAERVQGAPYRTPAPNINTAFLH